MKKIPERKMLQSLSEDKPPGRKKGPSGKAAHTPSGKNAIKTATMTGVFHQ
jgi:hypothetical protein